MYTIFYRSLLQALIKLTQHNSCVCPSFSSRFLSTMHRGRFASLELLLWQLLWQLQRFVSSTRNIEVLLSHTHSIVCDNDIGGLFLGCSKFCKMAAHNLKIHFNSLFMILHKKVSKMLRRVFLLIKRIDFMIQIHESFQSLTRTTIPILVSKRGSPTFSDWGHLLNINLKIYARTTFVLFDQFTWQKEVCTIEYLLH